MDPIENVGDVLVPAPALHPSGGERLTKQADAQDADVNVIMRRYTTTGVLPPQGSREGRYGDFTSALDFHTAMNAVRDAEEAFDSLPSKVRDRCHNDPGVFLDLVADPAKQAELVGLGLVLEQVPVKVPVQTEIPGALPPVVPAPQPS